MALDALVSVVCQKLRDVVAEESITNNKVIETQLKEMQEALEEMKGFFIDAADKETNVEAKKWTDDYLPLLYYVEDSIESFALGITRQRKRMGFLMNHALFLKNFTACKMLSRKLKKIQRKIDGLYDQKPKDVVNASLRSNRSLQNDSSSAVILSTYDYADHSISTSSVTKGSSPKLRSFSGVTTNTHDYADTSSVTKGSNPKLQSFSGVTTNTHDYADTSSVTKGSSPKLRSFSGVTTNTHDYADTSSVTKGSNPKLQSFSGVTTKTHDYADTSSVTKGSNPKLRNFSTFSSNTSFIRERFKQGKLMYNSFSDEQELYIVGFKQDLYDLVKRLIKGDDRIISLVGELGSGKTTLARAVSGNRTIKDHFKSLCWITISKDSSTEDFLRNLLKHVGESIDQDGGLTELQTRVRGRLKDRKYLIVLDGVGSFEVWENLKNAFPDQKNGSKIILTAATQDFSKSHTHYMKKLDDQDSWKLFLHKMDSKESAKRWNLKNKIIQICNGVPLNIVLLGSLLSTKKDEEWGSILDRQENWRTSDILSLCYNDLDAHSKLCLLYMMLFPQEYNIPIRRLLRLWLAEGFVKRPGDEVQGYFDNLVKRSLIQVPKLRSDGSPKNCRLLGALREYLLDDISLFHVHRNLDCGDKGEHSKRRLVEYDDANECSLDQSQFRRLRSYISFNSQKKDTPAKGVGNLLGNMIGKGYGLLRVLDLEGVYRPSLPDNLGDLFNLRYLGLRWTFLDKLPKSVGELTYLETLDLKRTCINRIPISIWKLKRLRHLNLNEISLDKDMSLHLSGSSPPLLTLWGLSVDPESPVKKCLSKLNQLRELGISFRLNNPDDHLNEDLLEWISKLTTLESLTLRSLDDSGRPSELSVKPLSDLVKLSNLNLLGKLQKLPETGQFPPNIKVLTLSVSQLDDDPMPILGRLQGLTVLRLLANSYNGKKIVCPRDTFTELRVLNLWMLNKLEEWELEEGAMEKLKELNIRCCSNLDSIPSRLSQQRDFKDLILTNMPQKFKENVKKNFRTVSITVKNYEFTPLPWELEDAVASNVNGYSNGEN